MLQSVLEFFSEGVVETLLERYKKSPKEFFAILITLPFAVALIRDTVYQGQDFEVFYRAGLNIINRLPVYDLARDGAMVFKYPPWIVPIFVPFALLPLIAAKYLWGLIQVLSIAYLFHWVRKHGVRFWIAYVTLVSFWGIWAVHALDGQVTLPFLVLFLRTFDGIHDSKAREKLFPHLVFWASTVKIFTASILLGSAWAKWDRKKIALSIFILLFVMYPTYVAQGSQDLIEFFRSWFQAAGSGSDQFGAAKIFGRENQGIPAVFVRFLQLTHHNGSQLPYLEFFAFLALLPSISAIWWKRNVGEAAAVSWSGWIAISAIIHPLAWIHHFVLVFPFVAFTIERSFHPIEKKIDRVATISLLILLTLVTSKTLGVVGGFFELISIKGIAVLGMFALWHFWPHSLNEVKHN